MATFEADLIFSDSLNSDANRYTLIELPVEIAAQFADSSDETSGERPGLVIRGLETDEAVICTPSTTYAVRSVQTSNTMLIVRPQEQDDNGADRMVDDTTVYTIEDCVSAYQELTPCQPRLDRLRHILEGTTYRGPVEEARTVFRRIRDNAEAELYSTERLLNTVQTSDAELLEGLKAIGALEIEGVWRLLDAAYLEEALKFLLASIIVEDMPMDRLRASECIVVMEEMDTPDAVVRHILEQFSDVRTDVAGEPTYNLSEKKVGRFFGEQLLANAEHRQTPMHVFLKSWREAVPEALSIDLTMLEGLYLIQDASTGAAIQYFPKAQLPLDSKARFETLFQTRKKWTHADILPYISDLAPSTKKLDAILLKYARMSRVGQQVVYTSRYAVK
ncbi:sister chromatid cohesion protein Dcc1 [Powellomyces hirtus]|nr:sister chromatid cohesion protein Dcc1 [Powellomyces hirtus]